MYYSEIFWDEELKTQTLALANISVVPEGFVWEHNQVLAIKKLYNVLNKIYANWRGL